MAKVILDVIGIAHRIEVIFMTGEAISWRTGISTGMAGDTFQQNMRAGQRKLGLAVIENHFVPVIGGMTL
ncbi:MAG: hypothetical protein GWN61_17125 [candidate division Zixibacteria bacterium]|nr:hypothetical protein [candidate division Zixibacteria bacterium]NIU15679.1 hypothetical protein [candidate division Zixibacteria bacterium]NIV07844.1 hypothetical protein [candidate division Zixibacteria bacterium]